MEILRKIDLFQKEIHGLFCQNIEPGYAGMSGC